MNIVSRRIGMHSQPSKSSFIENPNFSKSPSDNSPIQPTPVALTLTEKSSDRQNHHEMNDFITYLCMDFHFSFYNNHHVFIRKFVRPSLSPPLSFRLSPDGGGFYNLSNQIDHFNTETNERTFFQTMAGNFECLIGF